MKFEFSRQIFEKYSHQISRNFFQWEPSCSMRTDGQTDMMKLNSRFRNFSKALKNTTEADKSQMV